MENKQRIIQELVPGKQITLAHIIANPDPILYQKLGLNPAVEYAKAAIGVLTVSPAETAIIMADIGIKSSYVSGGKEGKAVTAVRRWCRRCRLGVYGVLWICPQPSDRR